MNKLGLRIAVAFLSVQVGLMASRLPALAIQQSASSTASAVVSSADPSFDLQLKAADLLEKGQSSEARDLIIGELAKKDSNARSRFELYYLLAFIDDQSENYKPVVGDLQSAQEMADQVPAVSLHAKISLTKRLGDSFYELRDWKSALAQYEKGLAAANALPEKDRARVMLLECIVGTLLRLNDAAGAEAYAHQLVKFSAARAESGRIADIGAWFWGQVQLSGVYRKLGKDAEWQALSPQLALLLSKMLQWHDSMESAGTLPTVPALRQEFVNDYVRDYPPSCLADYIWLAVKWRPYTLPIIRWQPPEGTPCKAAVLCIHGLGLENRSFTPFGRELAKRGFAVYALDIRGFGSWQAIKGQEDASFDDAVTDIGVLLTFIRKLNPGLPTFLLGESMGGGIALRAGMQYGSNLQGIVASVPSAERFGERKMSMDVAMHILRSKNRPFDIGHQIALQATSDEDLRRIWESDPKAKLKLTPVELMKFDSFMKSTTDQCVNIKTTPVFVLQGLKDKLVKPAGTEAIFDNIQCDDKQLLILGNAEHLIFESENQNQLVLDNLCSWLDSHAKIAPSENQRAAP
jgi:acylglycerol lipase